MKWPQAIKDYKAWLTGLELQVGLRPKGNPWLEDRAFSEFFQEEARLPEAGRLSASADQGLW